MFYICSCVILSVILIIAGSLPPDVADRKISLLRGGRNRNYIQVPINSHYITFPLLEGDLYDWA